MKPKHILKYKNVLSFKTTPQSSVSSSAGRNHWHPWMSLFPLVFGAASSTGCIEVCKKFSWGTYLSATGLRESHNPREISERWMAVKAGTLATVSSIIHPESPACAAQSLSICHTEYKQLLHTNTDVPTWEYIRDMCGCRVHPHGPLLYMTNKNLRLAHRTRHIVVHQIPFPATPFPAREKWKTGLPNYSLLLIRGSRVHCYWNPGRLLC